ncbi:hypothetical protein [Asticcacaulis endophyticus]|uniref:Uncharacterized protein n=1 Tax=Asticcacaulis endophyticus TaxID=1395890 RepID=A0A918QCZ7_9CAUL|nr:hypothetical protein [Asticcacaulis endophyticus]GGZ41439.1 hypothetical protein GCM10011273_30060 [Asticcacaulis endophyticus]
MNDLEKLLERFARSSNARWWVGERPEGRDGQVSRLIADRIDYPTSKADPFKDYGLVRLDRNQAAHVLAVAGTMSLAHFSGSASKGQIENASEALKLLDGDAVFLSNGFWGLRGPLSWTPLTDATFDCGVIGYDAASAFIFWVEEED